MGEKVETIYLRLRAAGKGDREAAREAGYAGRPPSDVTRMGGLIPKLKRERSLCKGYSARVDALNAKIKKLKEERDELCALMELCSILDPS